MYVDMYLGCICYVSNKYQRGNCYVCMYVVIGTSGGDTGFGIFRCFVNTCFLYMSIILQFSMYVLLTQQGEAQPSALSPPSAITVGILICTQKYRECSHICSSLQTYLHT